MVARSDVYAARLSVDYPERLDRVTTAFRVFLLIPIVIVLLLNDVRCEDDGVVGGDDVAVA